MPASIKYSCIVRRVQDSTLINVTAYNRNCCLEFTLFVYSILSDEINGADPRALKCAVYIVQLKPKAFNIAY